MSAAKKAYRTEKDFLGELHIAAEALHGIHTARAIENFPVTGQLFHEELFRAFGMVKLACAITNKELGVWNDYPDKAAAIIQACREMAAGELDSHIAVDRLQGGAGTSTNFNANEVLANRALEILGKQRGEYTIVSPTDDINRHQSTNDTYPTALKLAAIWMLRILEGRVVALQESFQEAEKRFAHVVKVGRTQLQDAVLTTLGREMSAYAEVLGRDRWRIYKCEEQLRVVNLGGTAIGTGIAAPRDYIFRVVDVLRDLTGIGFARSENLIDSTQNSDVFVEVSGKIKACASSLLKISTDLRLLSSGPEAGIGEIILPQRQAGSTIMPGKVNPVIPEAVGQVSMLVIGYDATIAIACSSGNMELNPFLPLVSHCLLDSIKFLGNACLILRKYCVDGMQANEKRCRMHLESSTATVTALVPVIGYEKASEVAKEAIRTGRSIHDIAISEGIVDEDFFEKLITPEAVTKLGNPL